ncbi:unnamed protein product, partial [Vitis vinifera]|uniref:Uncharacterized protein n=1 Tax=Vitis vinifera TaxID=29760 RepID=D7SN06_VITVI
MASEFRETPVTVTRRRRFFFDLTDVWATISSKRDFTTIHAYPDIWLLDKMNPRRQPLCKGGCRVTV